MPPAAVAEHFVASPALPASVGGKVAHATLANADAFNVTLRESGAAGSRVTGCGACELLTEAGAECALHVALTVVPSRAVNFTVTAHTVDDGLDTSARYERILVGADGALVAQRTYSIPIEAWREGVTVTVRGVDDALYEEDAYPR